MGRNQFPAPRSAVPISSGLPVPTYSSVTAATATYVYQSGQRYSNAAMMQAFGNHHPYSSGPIDHWPYQMPLANAQPTRNPYGYGYHPADATGAGASSLYSGYTYGQYPPTQSQWPQPYQTQGYHRRGQSQQPGVQTGDPSLTEAPSPHPTAPVPVPPPAQDPVQTQPPTSGSVDPEQVCNEFGILASLQPAQIEELLRDNPQLRDVVIAAINDAKQALPSSS